MYIRTLPSSSCWTCRSAFAPGQLRRCLSLVYLSGGNRDPGSPRPDLISGVAEPHAPPSAPTRSANASFILTSPHPHLMPARHSVRHCVFFYGPANCLARVPTCLSSAHFGFLHSSACGPACTSQLWSHIVARLSPGQPNLIPPNTLLPRHHYLTSFSLQVTSRRSRPALVSLSICFDCPYLRFDLHHLTSFGECQEPIN
jgi:hypothetical protein